MKPSMKQKLNMMMYNNRGLDKKAYSVKKSLDEISVILTGKGKKK